MHKTSLTVLTSLLLTTAGIGAPASAQSRTEPADPGATPEDEGEGEEVIVVGRRDPNAVIGDIPPENQLSPADIRAYGVASVAELLEAIAPQTASSRGRGGGQPIILLNGRRTSGFREIRDLPPEAILRTDILPEEVALKYGYRADQRVVNIILRPRFQSTATQLEGGLPTAGGRSESKADVTRLMIGEDGRTTLNFHAERNTALLENERNIALRTIEVDTRDFRSLIGSRRLVRATGAIHRSLFEDVSSTFNAQIEYSDGRTLLGPSRIDIGDALGRDTDNLSGEAGIALNGNRRRWRWSLTGEYALARADTETDRENAALGQVTDRARTVTRNGEVDLVASGPFASLPAGPANATLRLGGDARSLEGRAARFGIESETGLTRREADASINLDLPVARRGEYLSAIGNLTLNANAEIARLSDFGTMTSLGAGAYWSPIREVNIIASFTREDGAPSLPQLGNPSFSTPGARIFDFVTGRDARVELVTGGNPNLDADRRRVLKVGGTIRPIEGADFELRGDFTRSRTDRPIAAFPSPTSAIEAAFPNRFTRDADGDLVRVDSRPINYDSSARDDVRWGFNFSKPLRSARPSQAQVDLYRSRSARSGEDRPMGRQGEGGQGAGEGRGRFGGGFSGRSGGFGGGRGGGRLQLSVFHTVLLRDEVRIGPGVPVLDYLAGEAAEGSSGRSQHRIEANGGYFNNGLGARLTANWQSGSLVTGGRSGTLRFTPLKKVNANLFANFSQRFDLVAKYPWLRGAQARLSIDNIFDSKQRVRGAGGLVPANYQPDLLDPQGRTVKLSLRKLFLPPRSFFRRSDREGGSQDRERPTQPSANQRRPAGS